MEIIEKARDLRSENIYHALTLYRKGINLLLNENKSKEAVNSLLEYAELISTLKGVLGFDEILSEGAQKFEIFKQYNEAAQVFTTLANLYYRLELHGEAGYYYERAAENFFKSNLENNQEISSACFVKASECYEIISMRKKAEIMLKKGVFANSKKDIDEMENESYKLFDLKRYEESASKFRGIAQVYMSAIDNLRTIAGTSVSGELALSVKSKLTEYSAIFNLFSAISYMLFNPGSILIKENSLIASEFFKKSFFYFKGLLNSQKVEKTDILHFSYDLMWALIIFMKYDLKDQIDEMITELNNIPTLLKNKIIKSKYYKISQKILDLGLDIIKSDLVEINLGKFEKVRKEILDYISE